MQGITFIDPFTNQERYSLGDLGLAYLFADTFKDRLRYVNGAGNYFYFDGCVWKTDTDYVCARQCVKAFVGYLENILSHIEFEEFIKIINTRSKRESVIKDAKDVHPIAINKFDANPNLLNCLNGTIDLQTGRLRKHDSADFLSKKANVIFDPRAKCKRWNQFIDEIMCNTEELTLYLQKILGYGLSGDTSEDCLFIFYGPTTRNGKGTLMESICNLLGDYAGTIQPNSLAQQKISASAHSSDIARLAGIRLVNTSELPSDLKLNPAIVKQVTGGDAITTRFLYKSFFEYTPQFKIFISTNHLPQIKDDSLFSSRRLRLVPFDRHFRDEEQNRGLKKYFREENNKSGILNWLLEGYFRYKSEGLIAPSKAEELLREYRINSDVLGLYIENRLVPCDEKERTKTLDFHTDFLKWCKDENLTALSLKEFVNTLRQKNVLGRDRTLGNYIKGYRIKADE